jgi:hypothetical protein
MLCHSTWRWPAAGSAGQRETPVTAASIPAHTPTAVRAYGVSWQPYGVVNCCAGAMRGVLAPRLLISCCSTASWAVVARAAPLLQHGVLLLLPTHHRTPQQSPLTVGCAQLVQHIAQAAYCRDGYSIDWQTLHLPEVGRPIQQGAQLCVLAAAWDITGRQGAGQGVSRAVLPGQEQ